MFDQALQYRQNKVGVYQSYGPEILEYTPWTSTSGERGIRTILIKQVHIYITVMYCIVM